MDDGSLCGRRCPYRGYASPEGGRRRDRVRDQRRGSGRSNRVPPDPVLLGAVPGVGQGGADGRLDPEKEEAVRSPLKAEPGAVKAEPGTVKAELMGADLQTAILECIRGFPQSEEGYAVTRIADSLSKSAKPAAVKTTIDEMVEDG